MRHAMFGGEEATQLSGWSMRLAGTQLVLMLPIFFVGRVMGLSEAPANAALGALGVSAALAVIVGAIAAIWNR